MAAHDLLSATCADRRDLMARPFHPAAAIRGTEQRRGHATATAQTPVAGEVVVFILLSSWGHAATHSLHSRQGLYESGWS
jgi:hypothetical protein